MNSDISNQYSNILIYIICFRVHTYLSNITYVFMQYIHYIIFS